MKRAIYAANVRAAIKPLENPISLMMKQYIISPYVGTKAQATKRNSTTRYTTGCLK